MLKQYYLLSVPSIFAWGFLTEQEVSAIIMGFTILFLGHSKLRWNIYKRQYHQAVDFTSIVFTIVSIYMFLSYSHEALYKILRVIPFIGFPLLLVQIAGVRDEIPLSAFQYKLRKLLIGLISGFLIGCLIAKSREKIRNKIITEFDIRNIFGGTAVETFEVSEKDSWKESIQFLSNGILSKYKGDIKILNLHNRDKKHLLLLINLLNKNLRNFNFTCTDSIFDAFEKNNFLICIESSSTCIENLEKIKKNITLQNKNLIGIIFINKEYKLKDYYLINKIFSILSN